MLKIVVVLVCFVGFLFSSIMANAIAPPEDIAEENLKADVIAVGEVVSVHANDSPPHVVLNIIHIVKGFGVVNRDDQINVLVGLKPSETPKGVGRRVQGTVSVKVKEGTLVVVYIDHSQPYHGYFKPRLEGLSVITIGRPL